MTKQVLSVSKEIQPVHSSHDVGKCIVKSGQKWEHWLYAASQNDPPVMVDLPEGTNQA